LSVVRVGARRVRRAHVGRPAQRGAARLCGGSAGDGRGPGPSLGRAFEVGEDIEGGRRAHHGVQHESTPAGAGKARPPRPPARRDRPRPTSRLGTPSRRGWPRRHPAAGPRRPRHPRAPRRRSSRTDRSLRRWCPDSRCTPGSPRRSPDPPPCLPASSRPSRTSSPARASRRPRGSARRRPSVASRRIGHIKKVIGRRADGRGVIERFPGSGGVRSSPRGVPLMEEQAADRAPRWVADPQTA
jgi:hypothetical protein